MCNHMRATRVLGPMPEEQLFTLEELMNFHRFDAKRLTIDPLDGYLTLETTSVYAKYKGVYTWTAEYRIEKDGSFSVEGLHEESISELQDSFTLVDDSDPFVKEFAR